MHRILRHSRAMIRTFLVSAALAGPASATEPCHDLWFTRNLIFDRAGYCFGSVLGQSVFDNANCTTKDPALSAEDKATVARIRDTESWIGCNMDTESTYLALDALEARRALDTLPVLDRFESACIGWRGPTVPLLSGMQPGAGVIGQISPGDTISFGHEYREPFNFVTVHRSGVFVSLGWTDVTTSEVTCTQIAG